MSSLLLLLAFALLAVAFARMLKREQALTAEIVALTEKVRELSARVQAAEADVAHALTQTEISETLLVEKGVADEEDIELLRRRFTGTEDEGPITGDLPERSELN